MGGARSGLGGPMSLRVQRVSGMPCNVEIWVVDEPDSFTVYVDRNLITARGAIALQEMLRSTITGWRRLDHNIVSRALRAVTG